MCLAITLSNWFLSAAPNFGIAPKLHSANPPEDQVAMSAFNHHTPLHHPKCFKSFLPTCQSSNHIWSKRCNLQSRLSWFESTDWLINNPWAHHQKLGTYIRQCTVDVLAHFHGSNLDMRPMKSITPPSTKTSLISPSPNHKRVSGPNGSFRPPRPKQHQ